MNDTLWAMAVCMLLAGVIDAQTFRAEPRYSKEEREVVDIDQRLVEASLRGDVGVLEEIWAPDVRFVGVDGRIWNKTERAADFRSRNRVYSSQKTLGFHVRVHERTAIVTFESVIQREGHAGAIRDILTRVYMKRGALWQLIHQHAGLLERPR